MTITNPKSGRYFELKGKNAEKILHELAEKSFLVDWCFPNPRLPDGKELCDLLVVFDDIAIVWQIKDLKTDENGRYNEREVKKNLRQVKGARRRLLELKTPVKLSNARRRDEPFDPSSIKRVFLISLIMGGSDEPFSPTENSGNEPIHRFTREFTEIALNELDTICDFTAYLAAKEDLLRSADLGLFIVSGGEEDMLAYYFLEGNTFDRFKGANALHLEGGAWEDLRNRQEYIAKKRDDEISYYWDEIINRAHEGSPAYERVARELARPNRAERRDLSRVFFDARREAGCLRRERRDILERDGVTYVFLFMDDEESPRRNRTAKLQATCHMARGMVQSNTKIIGIATEATLGPTCAYDFCLMIKPDWTEQDQIVMERLRNEFGLFANPRTMSET